MTTPIHPGRPPHHIEHPVMIQQWRSLTYLHWPYPPEQVQATLPDGLEVDLFDGMAWVGLIPFHMVDIALPRMPPIPYLGTFPETNVRTYVVGPHGPGVWFHSLDINRLLPVLVARLIYRLPYMWSKMAVVERNQSVRYTCVRRWPASPGATSTISVEIGQALEEPTAFEHFLTARWRLYTKLGKRLLAGDVEHEVWPLHHARATRVDDGLVAATGLPAPVADAHVMYSPGVTVSVGWPKIVRG